VWYAFANASASIKEVPQSTLDDLLDGVTYVVVVEVTSHAGLSSTASTSFTVDRTPAVISGVYNGPMRNVACQEVLEPLRVSWESVMDAGSGVHSVEWSLGFQPMTDNILPKTHVLNNTAARVFTDDTGLLQPGMVVYSTLTITNGARMKSVAAVQPVRLVEPDCTNSFVCLPPPSGGVHPLMLPLVVGLAYEVSGRLTTEL